MDDSERIAALATVVQELELWAQEFGSWYWPAKGGLKAELDRLERENRSFLSVITSRKERLGGEPVSIAEDRQIRGEERCNLLRDEKISDEEKFADLISWHSEDTSLHKLQEEFLANGDERTAMLLRSVAFQVSDNVNCLKAYIES